MKGFESKNLEFSYNKVTNRRVFMEEFHYHPDHELYFLINGTTGAQKQIASTGRPANGGDHQHPSFNRKGDMVLFNNPSADKGAGQVCLIDLNQVEKP